MNAQYGSNFQRHLRVYEDRSEFHINRSNIEKFPEGVLSIEAKKRISSIRKCFENGFLKDIIADLKSGTCQPKIECISEPAIKCIDVLVDSVTSEVGRALVGLSVMQMCIKSIDCSQNIRLHKGSSSLNLFSWSEGISMRSLDRKFVTPVLREHNLVSLNADGFMMTRSLAENYPYTSLYKAKLKGARNEWLELVDQLENRETSALDSLKFMLSKLINRAKHFDHKANELIYETSKLNLKIHTRDDAISVIQFHMEQVDYASRLLEIGMHALGQAAIESGSLEPMTLKPLSQMRSANKKHGNIGDIEFLEQGEIVESWDAKYGKSYLREELEELNEKLRDHEHLELAGFVTTEEPERLDEIVGRAKSIEELYSIKIVVFQFRSWVDFIYEKVTQTELISEAELSRRWIHIYCLCLCQKRRDHAPIDEPCLNWVEALISQLRDME